MADKQHFNFFRPSDEYMTTLKTREAWRISYIIFGNIIFTVGFLIMGAVLLIGYPTVGFLSLIAAVCFIAALVFLRKDKLFTGTLISTTGLLVAVFIFLFFTPTSESTLMYYRSAATIVTLTVFNQLITVRKRQLIVFFVISVTLLVASYFRTAPAHLARNPSGAISAYVICTLAAIITNMIMLTLDRFSSKIINSAEVSEEKAQKSLGAITQAIEESKNGLEVGKRLYEETQIAGDSINQLTKLYMGVSNDATGLSSESVKITQSSAHVKNQATEMKASVVQQNDSISETSNAMINISKKLSQMSDVAESRRANLSEIIQNLDSQMYQIRTLVDEVEQVKESSEGIAGFVKTVDSIAAQTGLLAMNASIEAAHAGDKGKGFSVIAQEIRKLSEQTTNNASKISDELQNNTEVVKKTSSSALSFRDFTQKTTEELRSTVSAIEEILAGILEVNSESQTIMRSLEQVVTQSEKTGSIVDDVVAEINVQNETLTKMSQFAEQLHNSVDGMESQLNNIKDVVSSIENEANENIETTNKITAAVSK